MNTAMFVTTADDTVGLYDLSIEQSKQWLALHPPNTFRAAEFVEIDDNGNEERTQLEVH